MGFWKSLRLVLAHPELSWELETRQKRLASLEQELKEERKRAARAERTVSVLESHLKVSRCETDKYRAALFAACPGASSLEELKRFYEQIAPHLDKEGFTLYRAAERIAGAGVSSCFPYEDNLGLFDEMDGWQLLRYLTAAQFQAVTWGIVSSTCYERAVLGEVDTTIPEYRRFEQELYTRALEGLGWKSDPLLKQGSKSSRVTERNTRRKGEHER